MELMYLRIISFSICAGSLKAYVGIITNKNISTECLLLDVVGPMTESDAKKYHAMLTCSFPFVFTAWSVLGLTTSQNKHLLVVFILFHNELKYHNFVDLIVPHFSIISISSVKKIILIKNNI